MAVMFFDDMSLTVRTEKFGDGVHEMTLHAYSIGDVEVEDVLRALLAYVDAGLLEDR